MQTKQTQKKIIAYRYRCRQPGAGLSHYIMLNEPKDKGSKK